MVNLHRFLSRSQITALASAVANANVDGAKVKAKAFLRILAKLSGCRNEEAFLHAVEIERSKAFSATHQKVFFSKGKLVGIELTLNVRGYWDNTVRIFDAFLDKEGYLAKCEVRANIGGGEDSASGVTLAERMESSQIALNYAFEICEWVNANRKKLTPSDFEGWKIHNY